MGPSNYCSTKYSFKIKYISQSLIGIANFQIYMKSQWHGDICSLRAVSFPTKNWLPFEFMVMSSEVLGDVNLRVGTVVVGWNENLSLDGEGVKGSWRS